MRCIVKQSTLNHGLSLWVCTIKAAFAGLMVLGSATLYAHGTEQHGDNKNTSAEPDQPVVLAPGYESLAFPAPVVGTYSLTNLGKAGSGDIINGAGEATTLHELIDNRITVLSFIYRACDDVNGCPLATYVMYQTRELLAEHAELTDNVRLVSMSFDPVNDTPEAMKDYQSSFSDSPIDWQFVTAASVEQLEPILDAYDQPVSSSSEDSANGAISHILRVFLIDATGDIRNIYSANLLHYETLYHDILTLTQEENAGVELPTQSMAQIHTNTQVTPLNVDDRPGYSDGSYTSQSVSLTHQATAANLKMVAKQHSLGLPPEFNIDALSDEKIKLGRQLFFDRRLSINDTFSCAMCHIPQQAFTSNELATSVGVEGRTVKRNAPTLFNVGYAKRLFHDARESRLDQQVWAPLLAHNEMANPSIAYVLEKVTNINDYATQFQAIYGKQASMETLGDALAAYQNVLVAGNSPFDRWFFDEQNDAISEEAKQGFELFTGKAGCTACHSSDDNGTVFSDFQLHNTGIGFEHSMRKPKPHLVTLAPGVVVTVDPADYAAASEKPPNDLGAYEVTLNPDDRWKFKTPSLRNIALTRPYMHNGSFASLEDVVVFYNNGGIENPELSPLMRPLGLSVEEQQALVRFLESLTSDATNALINDGMAAPIGDVSLAQ